MEAFVPSGPTAATTGTFDGVHAGHLRILKRLQEVAQPLGGASVLVTFDPHPRKVIHPDFPLRLLTTLDERADLLEAAGLDDLVVQPFTPAFAAWSSLDFVRRGLVEHLNVKRLVIGYDHHFGRNREGTFAHLQEFGPVYGFEVEEIPPHDVEAVRVSSTKIRAALETGDVALAAQWLTRPYFCSGVVAHGARLGRDLGFPTANVGSIDPDKLLPKDGVYAVWVERLHPDYRGERLPGVANLGVRPTVDGSLWQLEAHVLDVPVENLYGQELRVHFVARLRDEHRFPDTEALKAQISRDADEARAALRAAR
jgi:riboflavin kinase/FMN adenylyltransferase